MTQSGLKKPKAAPTFKVEKPEPVVKEEPKTEVDLIIERLKAEKPQTYEQYIKAVKAKKNVSIYPDLTLRIG
tara:strand:- start:776 stop:991 length:216 start_codon:yes stop_codon:yes gene_type:complete